MASSLEKVSVCAVFAQESDCSRAESCLQFVTPVRPVPRDIPLSSRAVSTINDSDTTAGEGTPCTAPTAVAVCAALTSKPSLASTSSSVTWLLERRLSKSNSTDTSLTPTSQYPGVPTWPCPSLKTGVESSRLLRETSGEAGLEDDDSPLLSSAAYAELRLSSARLVVRLPGGGVTPGGTVSLVSRERSGPLSPARALSWLARGALPVGVCLGRTPCFSLTKSKRRFACLPERSIAGFPAGAFFSH